MIYPSADWLDGKSKVASSDNCSDEAIKRDGNRLREWQSQRRTNYQAAIAVVKGRANKELLEEFAKPQ